MENKPRVRFAPSPTGALHIGGARTALFNWLFARHSSGTFILRIEDTDRKRSTKEHELGIIEGMKWMGMDWDEGPYYQTQNMDIYKKFIHKLLDEGKAYKCTCTVDELKEMRERALTEGRKPKYDGRCRENGPTHPERPASIRFKASHEGYTEFHDLCRGTIRFENKEMDDLIIARSDGSPTYNLTVVVDDINMRISHVIRGDDHINNTPKQVMLYKALGYSVPKFAHLPMIYGPDKKKLSKRHGAASLLEYRELGFLPESLINYLARLGWSCGDQEIFTTDELIEKFDLSSVGNSPSVFDNEKLKWVNAKHMQSRSDEELVDMVKPFLDKMGLKIENRAYAAKALSTERERAKTSKELAEMAAFYFRNEIELEPKAAKKWLNDDGTKILEKLRSEFSKIECWNETSIKEPIESLLQETDLKMLKIAQPLRVAMTGGTVSPGIYEVLTIIGKEDVLKRIDSALKKANTL